MKSSKAIKDLVLRSDHRAVQSCILLPPEVRHRRKRVRKVHTDWHKYKDAAKAHQCDPDGGLQNLEKQLQGIAHMCEATEIKIPVVRGIH